MCRLKYLVPAVFVSLLLLAALPFGCGGGGGGGDDTGLLSLRVADAPVDNAIHVWIKFDGIEVKPAEGQALTFNLANTQRIDLLTMTNGNSASLLDGEEISAGRYNWIRLMVNTAPDGWVGNDFSVGNFSYLVDADGTAHALTIPSGDQTGLKLNRPFIVPAGGAADFTLDFDLRRSIHTAEMGTKYILRPTIRIVDNAQAGRIAGKILNIGNSEVCSQGAVYVFEGLGVTPDDVDGIAPDPIASAKAKDDGMGDCVYMVPFLAPGGYTVAFTWDAASDDPAVDDASVIFPFVADATVTDMATTKVDVTLP